MTLDQLATAVAGTVVGDGSVTVGDVTHDSRQAGPGTLFVAIRGSVSDGHDFIPSVVAAGTPALCVEAAGAAGTTPAIVVDDTRSALAPLAATVHGHPSHALRLVGVTGTNGKTTVTHFIESICDSAGIAVGLIGTVGARIRSAGVPVARTTPEASDFQRMLRQMVDEGVVVAAVEVSSHALALHRVDATRFAVGVFTNLSQDHLDFHRDMAAYEAAKASLFTMTDEAVVWADDPAGARIAASAPCPVVTVGTTRGAAVTVDERSVTFGGSEFDVVVAGEAHHLGIRLAGGFNVANAALAAITAHRLGIGWKAIGDGLGSVERIPGRFELVDVGGGRTVVVDYAHTPGGITAAIETARRLLQPGKRVVALVGAGGDRDRVKRPLMGKALAAADIAIITSDNPRSEDPSTILAEVASGAPAGVVVEIDRREAIRRALGEAGEGDVVLILGKGHEQDQDFGDRVVPFDDRLVAVEEARSV